MDALKSAHGAGRRRFLGHALGWCAAGSAGLLLPLRLEAQQPAQIRVMRGDVRINELRATLDSLVRAGDTITTGSDGFIEFVTGQDAFFLRARTQMRLEAGAMGSAVNVLRFISGAIGAVFARGGQRTVYAPTLTAGIRGTGMYFETRPAGTYACLCFGEVNLASASNPRDRAMVETRHHHAHLVLEAPRDGSRMVAAPQENHTDEEMERLEAHVGRRAPWVR